MFDPFILLDKTVNPLHLKFMENGLDKLNELHAKSMELVHKYEHLPEKDIRKKHLEILSTQIAVCLVNLKINTRFYELNREEFEYILNNDQEQIDNYIHHFIQNISESIIDAALFQSELIFRFYYSKITGKTPGEERSLHKITATIFEDTENNWTKEEAKLVILLWTLRNTIHTGGIYFAKTAGHTLSYKGQDFKFEYGKGPNFLQDSYIISLLSDLLESLDYLFSSSIINDLGSFEHPSYYALGQ
ncbi:hypothetical protein CWM47_34465 [Spirosoma pollinicola]|uniref:Uncharacterized protein n=2 Tax=Spirosoma pollinicola TaxID=2057025 RepID=A0A2K8Z9F0_9BACT|nr:hypothetical protein CWM47_34465 [Spirosoma pollinicola]